MKIVALVAWILTSTGFYIIARWGGRGGRGQLGGRRFAPALIFWQIVLASAILFLWAVYFATRDYWIGWIALAVLAPVTLLGYILLSWWVSNSHNNATSDLGSQESEDTTGDTPPRRARPVFVIAPYSLLVLATVALVLLPQQGTGGISSSAVSGNPKIDTFKDNFDAGISGNKWRTGGTTPPVDQDGAVAVNHPATKETTWLSSVNRFDLTGSSVYVEVLDFGNQSLAGHTVDFSITADASNSVRMRAEHNNLCAYKRLDNSLVQLGAPIPLDPVAHRWWRIREANGTTYFDTSPDSVTTWTNRWAVPNPINVTSVQIVLQSGSGQNESEGSGAIFDNLSTARND